MDFSLHEELFFLHFFLSTYFTFTTYRAYFQHAVLYYIMLLSYDLVLYLVYLIYHQSDSLIFFAFLEEPPFGVIFTDVVIFMISFSLEIFCFLSFLSFYWKMLMTFYFLDVHFSSLLLKFMLLSFHYLSHLFHFDIFNIQFLAVVVLLFVNFSDVLDIDADLSYSHYDIFVIGQIFQMSHLPSCLFGKFEDAMFGVYSIHSR